MTIKMKRGALAALAAAGIALSGCASPSEATDAGSEELTEVTVAVSSKIAYFVPYLMEEHWGEFAAEGIDLKVEIAPAQDALVMLATGKLDAMVTGPSANLLNAVADGTNVKIVAPGGIEAADSVNGWYISKAALGDQEFDVSMLEGKTLASSSGVAGPPLLSLSQTLATEGLTLADVDIKSMKQADTVIAIENGAVFGGTASQPNTAVIEEADSGIFFARSAPEDYPSVNVWFGSTLLDDAPEVGQRFVQALHNTYMNRLQGDWLHNPENIDLISEVLETEVDVLKDIPSTLYPEEFSFPENFIESYEEAFRQIPGVLTYPEEDSLGSSVIDTRFMEKISSK
ncbi:ABC transporter substrate-binding protein [Arthrobacter koreensis]|uniref:ABC transporter substrate-binding protein n=1 Tax=Arthrobacter koreensis TaxID=199136 RepID=UPI0036DD3FF3